jgi:hypothetical protein
MYVCVQRAHCKSVRKANHDFRPTLLFLTVVVALLIVMREAPKVEPQRPITSSSFLKYRSLEGYFLQDDSKTDPLTFDYVRTLIGRCLLTITHTCTR